MRRLLSANRKLILIFRWLFLIALPVVCTAASDPPGNILIHPRIDPSEVEISAPVIGALRSALRTAIDNGTALDEVAKPMLKQSTQPIAAFKGAEATYLPPSMPVLYAVYEAEKLRLNQEEIERKATAAKLEHKDKISFLVDLYSMGKGSGLNPYNASAGDRTFLEGIKFVLSIDEDRHLQVAVQPEIKITERERSYWAGYAYGGNKIRTDYYATYYVTFPLRDTAGRPNVDARNKHLVLRVIGPKQEWTAKFDILKLPEPKLMLFCGEQRK